ncbi:MAG: sensor domain-containing diguanylate cyclase [Defluviitaleaceae bacterium]|nr:sensor domain-containing diguanylate cyclase [Defluviitaleaceae bacterium]
MSRFDNKTPITEAQVKRDLVTGADAMILYDERGMIIDIGLAALPFFSFSTKEEFNKKYESLVPKTQPDGQNSRIAWRDNLALAFEQGSATFEWQFKRSCGEDLDCIIYMQSVRYDDRWTICAVCAAADNAGSPLEKDPHFDNVAHVMLDATPVAGYIFNSNFDVVDCNQHCVDLFGMESKGEMNRSDFSTNAPPLQPSGIPSQEAAAAAMMVCLEQGIFRGDWVGRAKNGRIFTAETTLVRVNYRDDFAIVVFLRETAEDYEHNRQSTEQRVAERRMRLMIDNVPMVCCMHDKDFDIIECNQMALDYYGFANKDDFLRSWRKVLPDRQPDGGSSPAVLQSYCDLAMLTGLHKSKFTLRSLHGSHLPTELTLIRVNWQGEDVLLSFVVDMTLENKLRQAEEAEQQKMKAIVDSSPLLCTIFDSAGNVIECNDKVIELFGLNNKKEYINKFISLFPRFQPDGSSSIEKFRELTSQIFDVDEINIQWHMQTLDGEALPLETVARRVSIGGRDLVITHSRDLREFMQSKKAQDISYRRLSEVLNSSPFPTFLMDDSLVVFDCNETAVNLFEFTSKAHLIEHFRQIGINQLATDGLNEIDYQEKTREALEAGCSRFEMTAKTLGGREIPAEVTLVRVNDDGKNMLVVYMEDMTSFYSHKMEDEKIRDRLQVMIDSSPMICTIFDPFMNVLDVNLAALSFYGIASKQEYIERFEDLIPERQSCGRLSADIMAQDVKNLLAGGGKVVHKDWLAQTINGVLLPVDFIMVYMRIDDRDMIISYIQDLREHHKLIAAEKESRDRFRALLDSSPVACVMFSRGFAIEEVNSKVLELFGLADKEEFANKFSDLHPEYQPDGRNSREKASEQLRLAFESGSTHFEWMHCNLLGEEIPCEISMICSILQECDVVLCYIRDLREIRAAVAMKEHLEQLAFTDALTEIANRRYFMQEARKQLAASNAADKPFALLMIDLDRFKNVNDTYGHPVGDDVLRILAKRVKNILRDSSILARYGGEEFIATICADSVAALNVAERVRQSICSEDFGINNLRLRITASVGLALKTNAADTLEEIINKADEALYRAKSAGRNRVSQ